MSKQKLKGLCATCEYFSDDQNVVDDYGQMFRYLCWNYSVFEVLYRADGLPAAPVRPKFGCIHYKEKGKTNDPNKPRTPAERS